MDGDGRVEDGREMARRFLRSGGVITPEFDTDTDIFHRLPYATYIVWAVQTFQLDKLKYFIIMWLLHSFSTCFKVARLTRERMLTAVVKREKGVSKVEIEFFSCSTTHRVHRSVQ